jgi:hypothetical protein
MDGATRLALAWFVIVSCACAATWTPWVRRAAARLRYPLICAAAIAVMVRILPAVLPMPRDALVQWDIGSYRLVADAVAHHRDVYDLPGRYPYLPLQMYVFSAAAWVAANTHLPFLLLVKLPAIAADAALTVIVGLAAAAIGRRRDAAALTIGFALNPVSMLVTAYHGQFDALPVTFALGAWAILAFRRDRWALPVSAILMGIAVADKTWPLLLAPILLWRLDGLRDRLRYVAIMAAVPIEALALYEAIIPGGGLHALRVVTGYQGIVGAWGYSELLVRAAGPAGREAAIHDAMTAGVWVLGGALICAYFTASRLRRDPERMAIVLATVYAAAAGWGVHWLAWLMPLAFIEGRRWGAVYAAGASAYAAAIYMGFGGVMWVAVYVSGSLGPAYWSPTVGLVVWAGITAAVAATFVLVLGREARSAWRGRRRAAALLCVAYRLAAGRLRPAPVAASSEGAGAFAPSLDGRPGAPHG